MSKTQKTNRIPKLIDSNFNQLSLTQALEAEAIVRGVGDADSYENGGIAKGTSPPIIEKIVTIFFLHRFW